MRDPRARVDCCRSCLRGLLRALNYLLAIVGVLMIAYALFMWVQWSEQAPSPASPPSSPSPAPEPAHHHHHHQESPVPSPEEDTTFMKQYLSATQHRSSELESLSEDEQSEGGTEPSGTGALAKYPWFIYVFGGAGLFVFITASVGILSADCAGCGVTCLLGLYHALMVLLLLLQISVVCFYFFDKSWESDLPKDTTGEYKKMRELVMDNLRACQVAGLCTLALQLLALLVSCSLYYAESRPRLAYNVLRQHEYETGSQGSYPVAERIAGPSHRGGGGHRGRDKYSGGGGGGGGVHEPLDPEAGRGGPRGMDDDEDDRRNRCSIM